MKPTQAVAKLLAGREKDIEYVSHLLDAGYISRAPILELGTELTENEKIVLQHRMVMLERA